MAKEKKLSPSKLEILRRLDQGDVLHYMGPSFEPEPYFFWSSDCRSPRRNYVYDLIDAGLVELYGKDSCGHPNKARITEAGRRRVAR